MLGKPVAHRLKADGFSVRILARSPEKARKLLGDGFEIVQGDVEQENSLIAAMSGVEGVHISLKGGPKATDFDRMDHLATRNIARVAKVLGVGRVTLLSAYAVREDKADSPESRAKLKGEAALKASGVPYTIFRCSWFMESLPLFVQGNSMSLIGQQKHKLHWLAAADFARMVSRSYHSDAALMKELSIYGPEPWTMREAMQLYLQAARPGVKIAPISTSMLDVIGALTFNVEWRGMAALMSHYERWGEDGSPEEANRILGAPTITLPEWCKSFSAG